MKRIFAIVPIVLGVVAAAPEARADPPRWGVTFGVGPGGAHVGVRIGGHAVRSRHYRHAPPVFVRRAPVVHVHERVAVVKDVWVPARYEKVFVGYGFFGRPIYRTVCVSPGHYEKVLVGHRCATCGCAL